MKNKKKYRFGDFTEKQYRIYLNKAKQKFEFIPYEDHKAKGNLCLWRHDIDTSPHRAYQLAGIEHEENIRANYFIHIHSNRYNLLEKENTEIVKSIKSLGHFVGLHFDAGFYKNRIHNFKDLEKYVKIDKKILEDTLEMPITSFSFHNPSLLDFDYSQEKIGGMINSYANNIQKNYSYISDSYCIWRFKSLEEVLNDPSIEKLHVLLHPVCWSEKSLSPYKRFKIAVDRRRDRTLKAYMDFARDHDRPIIK